MIFISGVIRGIPIRILNQGLNFRENLYESRDCGPQRPLMGFVAANIQPRRGVVKSLVQLFIRFITPLHRLQGGVALVMGVMGVMDLAVLQPPYTPQSKNRKIRRLILSIRRQRVVGRIALEGGRAADGEKEKIGPTGPFGRDFAEQGSGFRSPEGGQNRVGEPPRVETNDLQN